jgi:hypothetical protein
MTSSKSDDPRSEDETMRRMNEALKRALAMPPKPHKPIGKKRPAKKDK